MTTKRPIKYSRKYFIDFFSKLRDEKKLGVCTLMTESGEPNCALAHIGIRPNVIDNFVCDKNGGYKFSNSVARQKFEDLCAALQVEPYQNNVDKNPIWSNVTDLNDNNKLISRLRRLYNNKKKKK